VARERFNLREAAFERPLFSSPADNPPPFRMAAPEPHRPDRIAFIAAYGLLAIGAAFGVYVFLQPSTTVAPTHFTRPDDEVRDFSIARNELGDISRALPSIRHLEFRHAVPVVIESEDAALNDAISDRDPRFSDEYLKIESDYRAMLGLFKPGADLRSEQSKAFKQLLGFYESRQKRMVIVSGVSADNKSTVIELLKRRNYKTVTTLAHEMTHALQDQNFDLEKLRNVHDDSDRLMALKAVVEGDATVTGFVYGLRASNTDEYGRSIELGLKPQETPWDAIELVSTSMPFEYSAGARFVHEAIKRGGWRAVDKLFSNPPVSTQQIAYPQLYFDRVRVPQQIAIRGYEQSMAGWKPVKGDTLGVLLITAAFRRNDSWSEQLESLPRHWAGDRLVVLRKENALSVIWLVAFDNPGDAARFAWGYAQVLDKIANQAAHHVERRGDNVMVLVGEGSQRPALISSLWSGSTVRGQSSSADD
jgi:hypothetical protein